MQRYVTTYAFALIGIAALSWLTSMALSVLGIASSALLFLLPVLYAAVRGGIGPGLFAAIVGAAAYNFFLLPPRFTFQVHGLENLVSVFVLVAVAVVTSRLATRLMVREAEALERARLSDEVAELSAILAGHPAQEVLAKSIDWISERYGDFRLLAETSLLSQDAAYSSLDLAAAAWALHNGGVTGNGTEVMPAADWTFFPLTQKNRKDGCLAALPRPTHGGKRDTVEIAHLSQLCLLLGQCRDREALETERRERERLEEADRLLRTFLASLAHDFRTPLTVILGRLALLAHDNPDACEALASAQRLDRMMTDLIGAARIEAGSLAPVKESLDLVDVIAEALGGLIVPTGISVERNVPSDLPFVTGDPVLLHHVMTNLIDNALRHATTTVTLDARQKGENSLFIVSDDGPGVPEAERDRIFERFVRLEGNDRMSGSGLGLAIVKGFSDTMGIGVSVDSVPSGGTRFMLTMPVAIEANK